MAEYDTIDFEVVHPHRAIITLNRPDSLNASNSRMREEMGDAWRRVNQDSAIRVTIITGTGTRAFCVGQDLKETAQEGEVKHAWPGSRSYHDVWKPVICAVNGMCVGGGLHFIADSDIVICSEEATFFDTHVAVGNVFALEPIMLSRRIPLGSVLRMMLLGKDERMSAQRAFEIGLVSEVVPAESLRTRALELADLVAKGSPATIATSLQAVWQGLDVGLKVALDSGRDLIRQHRETHPDFEEGVRAFVERREPRWSDGPS